MREIETTTKLNFKRRMKSYFALRVSLDLIKPSRRVSNFSTKQTKQVCNPIPVIIKVTIKQMLALGQATKETKMQMKDLERARETQIKSVAAFQSIKVNVVIRETIRNKNQKWSLMKSTHLAKIRWFHLKTLQFQKHSWHNPRSLLWWSHLAFHRTLLVSKWQLYNIVKLSEKFLTRWKSAFNQSLPAFHSSKNLATRTKIIWDNFKFINNFFKMHRKTEKDRLISLAHQLTSSAKTSMMTLQITTKSFRKLTTTAVSENERRL